MCSFIFNVSGVMEPHRGGIRAPDLDEAQSLTAPWSQMAVLAAQIVKVPAAAWLLDTEMDQGGSPDPDCPYGSWWQHQSWMDISTDPDGDWTRDSDMVLVSSLGQDVTLLWFGSADHYERDEPSVYVALEHYVAQIPAIFMALGATGT